MAEISKHVGISSERILKTRQGKKMKQLLTVGEKKQGWARKEMRWCYTYSAQQWMACAN